MAMLLREVVGALVLKMKTLEALLLRLLYNIYSSFSKVIMETNSYESIQFAEKPCDDRHRLKLLALPQGEKERNVPSISFQCRGPALLTEYHSSEAAGGIFTRPSPSLDKTSRRSTESRNRMRFSTLSLTPSMATNSKDCSNS
ncbi:uncharacterized protein G2W53_033973 [Senna tora]|uniref:Uncharacterized protein n=1 Tax=Senna tora TaxID=362788 RepID=A0A834T166_9FABA|nr:uncharacterized protein G2W53_033973 [Senna tora]